MISDVRAQFQRWLEGERGRELLLSGRPLEKAQKKVRDYGDEVPEELRGFIANSGKRARRQHRLRQALFSIGGVAATALFVLAVIAISRTSKGRPPSMRRQVQPTQW